MAFSRTTVICHMARRVRSASIITTLIGLRSNPDIKNQMDISDLVSVLHNSFANITWTHQRLNDPEQRIIYTDSDNVLLMLSRHGVDAYDLNTNQQINVRN